MGKTLSLSMRDIIYVFNHNAYILDVIITPL